MGKRLHDWFIETWYGDTRRGAWLLPLAALFAAAAAVRRGLYRTGLLRSYRSPRVVVVVGNLTVGGAGKTPLAMWLAGELLRRGLRVGIALRGYRGAHGDARRVEDGDSAEDAGDEAVMVRRRMAIPVAVGRERAAAVRLLEPDCDVIVCDDGSPSPAAPTVRAFADRMAVRVVRRSRAGPAAACRARALARASKRGCLILFLAQATG